MDAHFRTQGRRFRRTPDRATGAVRGSEFRPNVAPTTRRAEETSLGGEAVSTATQERPQRFPLFRLLWRSTFATLASARMILMWEEADIVMPSARLMCGDEVARGCYGTVLFTCVVVTCALVSTSVEDSGLF
mmetsp:Transcript_27182/g.71542  ORF Transcript_27182/g.71542 Transcript_27182/m.71542 type:complete len:132 (+) Transcript_27182:751-1146(+)